MRIFLGSIFSVVIGFLIFVFHKELDFFRKAAVVMMLGGWGILCLGLANVDHIPPSEPRLMWEFTISGPPPSEHGTALLAQCVPEPYRPSGLGDVRSNPNAPSRADNTFLHHFRIALFKV